MFVPVPPALLASQEAREAVGPVRSMAGFALFMMIL
jgi:hypothetical protein